MFDKKRFYNSLSAKNTTITKLAEKINVHQATLFRKVKGESEFTRDEMQKIRDTLSLSQVEFDSIFFA